MRDDRDALIERSLSLKGAVSRRTTREAAGIFDRESASALPASLPIFGPAEARYWLIAREMVESGDWIQPRLSHVRYDEKPPLQSWAIGASYGLFGQSEPHALPDAHARPKSGGPSSSAIAKAMREIPF